jgi:hypothetical protein
VFRIRPTILPAVFPGPVRLAATRAGIRHEPLSGEPGNGDRLTISRNVSIRMPIPGDHAAVRASEIYAACLGAAALRQPEAAPAGQDAYLRTALVLR